MSHTVSTVSAPEVTLKPPARTLRSRCYCLTINNYTDESYCLTVSTLNSEKCKYIVGKEVAKTTGTKHLQCYIEFPNQRSFSTIKNLFPTAHIEVARGSKDQNRAYCMKEKNYISNFVEDESHELLEDIYGNVIWKPWQQKILNLIETQKSDRIINWVYDPMGCGGKSFLSKYLFLKHGAILADGKKADVFNQIKTKKDMEGYKSIKLVVQDIPRHQLEYINYGMLEQIKDGLIYSGKYEGGCLAFKSPIVIVFSNDKPDMSKWTDDRYNIIDLRNKNLD